MKIVFTIVVAFFLFLILGGFFLKYPQPAFQRDQNKREAEGLEALQFTSDMESYPDADIPKDAFTKAYSFYKANYLSKKQFRESASNSWESLGPGNVAGRTLAIAVDPVDTNVLWAGAAGGGLWKSTTGGLGGNAWTYVPIGFPVLGVSCIAINPSNHNEIFIGTGEVYKYQSAVGGFVVRTTRGSYGMGIFKSTDGGNTWSPSLDWSYQQTRGIWKIVFNPKNIKTLYAATTEGVYKSLDEGASWNLVLNQQMVMDLQIDPSDSTILYAGAGDQGNAADAGVYKTNNGGATWSHVLAENNTGRTSISIYPLNPSVVYAEVANKYGTIGIFRSANKGQNWTQQISDFTDIASIQGWYAKTLLVKGDNDSQVLAGGVDFFKSADFGQTWITTDDLNNPFNPPHVDFHDIVSNPKDPNKIYAVSDGGLFRSNDFGSTFYAAHDGMITTQFYGGDAAIDNSQLLFGGLQDNSVVQYEGSNPWKFYLDFGDGEFPLYNNLNHNVQSAASNSGYAAYTTDGGNNWIYSFYDTINFPNASPAFVGPLVKCLSDPDRLYSCYGGIYKSTDFGANFYLLPGYTSNLAAIAIGVSVTSADTFYVGSSPVDFLGNDLGMHFFRTFDGGITLTDITGTLPDRYPRDIAVDPNDSKIVYAVFSGFGTGHVFETTDAGNSWSDISGALPDLPVNSVLIDPVNTSNIYIGTDFNIYVTTDDGNNWTDYSTALPEVTQVYRLVNSAADRKIIAFTHGHGAFKGNYLNLTGINPITAPIISLQCFPNPATAFLEVKMESNISQVENLVVRNAEGKIIHEEKIFTGNKITLNTSSLRDGLYFCSAESKGERKATRKFVVMH